jgi:hypothetical protein
MIMLSVLAIMTNSWVRVRIHIIDMKEAFLLLKDGIKHYQRLSSSLLNFV